jgi:hypothetical protein
VQSSAPFFRVVRTGGEGASACGCGSLIAAGHYTTIDMVSLNRPTQKLKPLANHTCPLEENRLQYSSPAVSESGVVHALYFNASQS